MPQRPKYICPACNGLCEGLGHDGPVKCAYCDGWGGTDELKQAERAGRLIAAGPALLEACKLALTSKGRTYDCDCALVDAVNLVEGEKGAANV